MIVGIEDKSVEGLTDAYCIAKIRRLVGPISSPVKKEYELDFAVAEWLETNSYEDPDTRQETPFIKVGTLR